MRKMKKLVSMALAVAMAASLIGCGSKATETAGDKSTEAPQTQAPEAAADKTDPEKDAGDGAGGTEKVNIRWAVWDIPSTTYYQPLIDAYQKKNPNVTVEMVDLGSQDYMTALMTQLSGSDTNLDVVMVKDIPGYANLVSKNVLEPIDTGSIDKEAYGGITDQILVDGKLYAIPFRSDFWVLFYNKDIFDAAGVDYPANDMTFEQYDELARKVSKDELGSEVYGSHYHIWRSAVQLFGILDGKNSIVDGSYDFLKPYYEMVLNQQNDGICQDYATLKTSGLHYSAAFAQSNVAMMNMGIWFVPTLIEKIKTGEYADIKNWGIVKYPHAEGVEPGSTLATITSIAVTSASKNKEAATDFMNFICGPEGAEILAATGTFPAMKTDAVMELIAGMDGFPADENSKAALETANTYLEMPIHEKSAEIEVVLNEAHDYIMTGAKSIDEGIAYMNEEIGKLLQ